jgi:hypothetical protein
LGISNKQKSYLADRIDGWCESCVCLIDLKKLIVRKSFATYYYYFFFFHIFSPRTVQLFQLTCWPMGHKVPTSTNSLVELMNMVERWRQKTDYGPVVVVSP